MLLVEGRLENADLLLDTKHPFILPSRHALTRLIILQEHINAGHARPSYTLIKTRQQFCIIFGAGKGSTGSGQIEYVLRDISKIAPV